MTYNKATLTCKTRKPYMVFYSYDEIHIMNITPRIPRHYIISCTVLLLCMASHMAWSQDIHSHIWKNRVLLLVTDSFDTPQFIKQRAALINDKHDLQERKLVVYEITEKEYRKAFSETCIPTNTSVYRTYALGEAPIQKQLKIILIGLDGGVKLTKSSFTPPSAIFATIDQMPMRRYELDTKG